MEELLVSSLAQADALAKLLIEKGLIAREEFMQKLSAERAAHRKPFRSHGSMKRWGDARTMSHIQLRVFLRLRVILVFLMVLLIVIFGGNEDREIHVMDIGDVLIWEAANGFLLIPVVIGLVILMRRLISLSLHYVSLIKYKDGSVLIRSDPALMLGFPLVN